MTEIDREPDSLDVRSDDDRDLPADRFDPDNQRLHPRGEDQSDSDLGAPDPETERYDPDFEPDGADLDVVSAGTSDEDLERARGIVESDSDQLTTDELRPEEESLSNDPADHFSTPTAHRETEVDEFEGESFEERIAQEEPDVQP